MESFAYTGPLGDPSETVPEEIEGMPDAAPGGRSEDRLAGRLAILRDEADPGTLPTVPAPESDPILEQIQQPLLREALRFRQSTSGSMTVIVCLDAGAELLVHFAQANGGVEAIARCDSGDASRLGALWPQLQDALAPRRIRLAPLRSVASPTMPPVSLSKLRGSRNDLPTHRPGWETWA